MEQYTPMKSLKLKPLFCLLLLAVLAQPMLAERASLKLSFITNSISGNDVNTWIESYNTLWQDVRSSQGGDLQGQFTPIDFGSTLEFELRIPLYKGFAINFAGSYFSSSTEGRVDFIKADGTQTASQFISNSVSAYPMKIGFSYAFPIPALPRLKILAGLGREIIFVKYKSSDNFENAFTQGVAERYWYEKESEYNSEKLGWYLNFGAEFDLLEFLAIVAEGEKVWGVAVDGFKGPQSYKGFILGDPDKDTFDINGKASLYFYELQTRLNNYYATLAGQFDRPEGDEFREVRQGLLDFNTFSLKIGIRFKF
ncbi:MAG: hypothetical protein GQ544_05645 [Candidatus Aminicenantes bacterium]|nr:hypothetical protein [Candidatus Aminicenantes bacterium]